MARAIRKNVSKETETMKLKDLLAGLELLGGNADPEQEITGVS